MEGQQEFDEEPFEALVAKLTKQKNTNEKKYQQLSKVVATGKTLVTSEGTKLVTVPKSSAARVSAGATPRVSSSSPGGSKVSTIKIIPGQKLNTKVKWEDQVLGVNKHGPSKNM